MMQKSVCALLLCVCMLSLVGCKKEPKSIFFDGVTYVKKKKFRAFAFKVVSYIPEGKSLITAKRSINYLMMDTERIKTKEEQKVVMSRLRMMIKRWDKKHKHYENRTKFCYRQPYRGHRLLIFAAFDFKNKDLRMFQFQKVLTKEKASEDIDDLCENAKDHFDDLKQLAQFFK